MKNGMRIFFAGLLVTVLVWACEKDRRNLSQLEPKDQANSLTVSMTDNPGDYVGLEMEITRIDAYLAGSGWVNLTSEQKFVDVARLTNGKAATLTVNNNLQAGNYTKIRVVFGDQNKLTFWADVNDGSGLRVAQQTDISVEGEKEVIVNVDVQINASAGATVLLDFDIVRSVIVSVNGFVVKPVLRWVKDEKTAVTGEIEGSVSAAVILTNGQDSVSAYTDFEGRFYLRGMKSGVYRLVIFPARRTLVDALREPIKIEGVMVTEGEVKYLGAIDVQ